MLNPKLQRYADRMRELAEEGDFLMIRTGTGDYGAFIVDAASYLGWQSKCLNVINLVFGAESIHAAHFEKARTSISNSLSSGKSRVSIMRAALSDLEGGFVHHVEVAIASEVFDSVLEQAKYLNHKGYKDAAAVLGRTVIEDALKRLARSNGLEDTKKASAINESLKNAGVYHQPMWRQVQAWTDIGNSAAHGDFHEYTQEQVRDMLEGIGGFLANHFT